MKFHAEARRRGDFSANAFAALRLRMRGLNEWRYRAVAVLRASASPREQIIGHRQ